jgi:thiamine pyrophosphokinase
LPSTREPDPDNAGGGIAPERSHPSSGEEEGFLLRVAIVANGILRHPELDRSHIGSDNLIIAADGGLTNCRSMDLYPDVLIGDLDSVSESDISSLQARQCEILSFPQRKDETDLELALLHAAEQGAKDLVLIGALGARWDQTLTNLLIGFHPAAQGIQVRIVDGPHQISYVQPAQPTLLQGHHGDVVSLIPINGDALGIHTTGLEYELVGDRLIFGRSRGISNMLIQNNARIEIGQGVLICIHTSQLKADGGES